ncbi:hypothetical protein TorRG33x02_330280 [Trema orientale]|uniref:Uncharacterized protein n=1 Tax=Trema orientale TaxID=63057 RepID=A0A2P5B7G4_TREOI|nr:hypothetical protein TorRG33x02_330280 [Trema orientale]
MGNGGRGDGAVHVEVEVTDGTLVAGSDADLLAAVALEWEFRVVELELVMGVAEVGDLAVSCHGFGGFNLFGKEINIRGKYVYI